MDKKRKKTTEKEAGTAIKTNPDFKPRSKQPEIRVQPRPIQNPGILNEKDKQILDDVQNIIWNPDRLNKFKNDGNAAKADGLSKKKIAK